MCHIYLYSSYTNLTPNNLYFYLLVIMAVRSFFFVTESETKKKTKRSKRQQQQWISNAANNKFHTSHTHAYLHDWEKCKWYISTEMLMHLIILLKWIRNLCTFYLWETFILQSSFNCQFSFCFSWKFVMIRQDLRVSVIVGKDDYD